MKSRDILLLVVVGFFSGVVSIIASNFIFTSASNRDMTAEVVDPISSEFQRPDPNFFNQDSINPTQLIEIGGSDERRQPF